MAQVVCSGALLQCSFGSAPSTLQVTPEARVTVGGKPAATVLDNVPMKNVFPFGMCTTLSNPQVAAATAAAQGVLTPQPCLPVPRGPWGPGSPTVRIGGNAALTVSCSLMCAWGGLITVANAGQTSVSAP
ncbi:MAG: DUF4280 domain-containing protein [Chloroflexia bacterium]